jgi:hypothetical protein
LVWLFGDTTTVNAALELTALPAAFVTTTE